MTRTKSIIGALALCALSICAFAAVSASAAELTAVTCEAVTAGTGKYNSHCPTPQVVGGNFETKAIPLNTTTEVTAKNTETEPALRATIGGAAVTVKCSNSELVGGSIKNVDNAGKHKIETTATRNTYTGCKAVVKANEARFCLVEEVTGPNPTTIGMVSTVELKGSTTGVNHQVKVEPKEGALFSKFNILNKTKGGTECPFNADVPVEVTGSVEGEADTTNHSHLTFTEANNGTALKANGGAAKYVDTVGGEMKGTENTVGAETFT